MGKDLRFCRVALTNWKNFAQVDVDLHDRAFLVGANASGKSNFLDVFRFLKDIASVGGGFQEAVGRRGGVTAIRCLAARRSPEVEVCVELKDRDNTFHWKYTIAFTQDKQRRPQLCKEQVSCYNQVMVDRPNPEDSDDPARLSQTYLEQVNMNRPFRDLVTFFCSVRYLHIVPQLVREPDRSVGHSDDPFGGDFLEQIAQTPEKTRNARMRRIKDALQFAVPQLQEISLHRDNRGTPHLRGKFQHWRARGAWQGENQLSDGTLRLIGLLWAIQEKTGPLLLEEPELSLHPEIINALPQMFARMQRRIGRQIFVSTHSPELLRDEGIGLDEVLLFMPEDKGTTVTAMTQKQDVQQLLESGLTLADVVIPQTRPAQSQQLTRFGDV